MVYVCKCMYISVYVYVYVYVVYVSATIVLHENEGNSKKLSSSREFNYFLEKKIYSNV